MNLNIREHIKNNFKNSNEKDIEEAITSSIKQQDEVTLPGLGVLFETLWEHSKQDERQMILKNIKNGLF